MSKTEMNGKRNLVAVSRNAIMDFCNKNNIRVSEIAEISGYASCGSFSNALKSGYLQAAALSNIYQFFALPEGYFDHYFEIAAEEQVIEIAKPETKTIDTDVLKDANHPIEGINFPGAPIKCWELADKLMDFYGETDYTALFVKLVGEDYRRHEKEILAKKYENMSREELIAELLRKDSGNG